MDTKKVRETISAHQRRIRIASASPTRNLERRDGCFSKYQEVSRSASPCPFVLVNEKLAKKYEAMYKRTDPTRPVLSQYEIDQVSKRLFDDAKAKEKKIKELREKQEEARKLAHTRLGAVLDT